MVSYRVMLDVPRDLIWFVSGLLAGHRRQIVSPASGMGPVVRHDLGTT